MERPQVGVPADRLSCRHSQQPAPAETSRAEELSLQSSAHKQIKHHRDFKPLRRGGGLLLSRRSPEDEPIETPQQPERNVQGVPCVRLEKLRLSEVKSLFPHHTDNEQQSQDSSQSLRKLRIDVLCGWDG